MADSQGQSGEIGRGGQYSGPVATDVVAEHDPHDDPAFITRTKFLSGIAVVTGGVMTAAILVPVVGFAVADSVQEEEWRWVDIGAFSDFPEGQVTSIAVSGPNPESDRRAFVRNADGAMTAIWNRCAHLGCPVKYAPGADSYSCPCHGGSYDSVGRVTAGPPPRPLDRFDVKIVGKDGKDVAVADDIVKGPSTAKAKPEDRVLIGRPFSLDKELQPYRIHGPGEPLDGPLKNLYPF
ncbi:MAG: Rieske 2Fe-2S domain-containing protein [Thermoleophilia bacterium]